MRETRFIAQNKEKWLESENLLDESDKNPEKLSTLFTQVVDDLSYSRTYYQNRSVRVYLNKIAREYFSVIYSQKKEKKNRFRLFWLDEIPQIILRSKTQLLIALFVFLLSLAIGVFSSMKDTHFTETILGEGYVSMTKANIEKGDPMAVYKSGHQVDMFLGITLNNLMVAFRTYVFGIFFSIGTLGILLYNGIMVGCFQYFFFERGLFAQSAMSIWLHGTLEISSIILSGGAGLVLGTGLIFPGTYSRLQAFQISATRSLKLMLGITPLFVIAGFIEGFLTRYSDMPDALKLLLIVLSAALIIGYFVIYPWIKWKKGFEEPLVEVKLAADTGEEIVLDRIKGNAELIKDAFLFYKKNLGNLLPWIVLITTLMTIAGLSTVDLKVPARVSSDELFPMFFGDLFYAMSTPTPAYILINALGSSLIIHRVFSLITNTHAGTMGFIGKSGIQTMLLMGFLYAGMYTLGGGGVAFFLIFLFVVFLLTIFVQHTEEINLFSGAARSWKLVKANFGQVMGLQLTLLLITISFLMILSAPLLYMYTSILKWNFAETDTWSRNIVMFIERFIRIGAFNMIVPILAASTGYVYYSLREILSADHLKQSISMAGEQLSKRKR